MPKPTSGNDISKSINIITFSVGWRFRNEVLHDLGLLAVGVGRNQLHLPDVSADGFALCLDAAAVHLHAQASQTHPCEETGVTYGHKVQ